MKNFYYVNLPAIPEEFIESCLNNIPLSWLDPKLVELNKKEGVSHSITYLPKHVKEWIVKNIIPLLDPTNEHPELVNKMFLHINEYIEHNEGNGVHPIHIDYGRKFAFNYILTLGGEKPITTWYQPDKKTVVEEHVIEVKKWHLIFVNPAWHGVRGQEPGKLRTIISLCFDPKDLNKFSPSDHFKDILL